MSDEICCTHGGSPERNCLGGIMPSETARCTDPSLLTLIFVGQFKRDPQDRSAGNRSIKSYDCHRPSAGAPAAVAGGRKGRPVRSAAESAARADAWLSTV